MDPGQIGGIAGGAAALGGAVGALLNRFYSRGRQDATVRATDMQHAASIVRLETIVHDLADQVQNHFVEDAKNFGQLFATTTAMVEAVKEASKEMRELTATLARAVVRRE